METKAYIISNNRVVSVISTTLKNGTIVDISDQVCVDMFDRQLLVNKSRAKISRAKKWEQDDRVKYLLYATATEISDRDFLLE